MNSMTMFVPGGEEKMVWVSSMLWQGRGERGDWSRYDGWLVLRFTYPGHEGRAGAVSEIAELYQNIPY